MPPKNNRDDQPAGERHVPDGIARGAVAWARRLALDGMHDRAHGRRCSIQILLMDRLLARRTLNRMHRHRSRETRHDLGARPEHLGDAVPEHQNLVDHADGARPMRNDHHRGSALLQLQDAVGQRGIASASRFELGSSSTTRLGLP